MLRAAAVILLQKEEDAETPREDGLLSHQEHYCLSSF